MNSRLSLSVPVRRMDRSTRRRNMMKYSVTHARDKTPIAPNANLSLELRSQPLNHSTTQGVASPENTVLN